MEYAVLSNGIQIPKVGIGTFQLRCTCTEPVIAESIDCEYRLIDTANAYLNETEIGFSLQKKMKERRLKRDDFFISTKIWPTQYDDEHVIDQTLDRLQTEYIDLLMIHHPTDIYMKGYEQIEQAYEEGKVKAIGVSNMNPAQVKDLMRNCRIHPHVIQMEMHPYCYDAEVCEFYKQNHMRVMSWYPLGHADEELFHEPLLLRLAQKYEKSVAQVLIRWQIQKEFIVIPGTKNPKHMKENMQVFDFLMKEEEIKQIDFLSKNRHFYKQSEKLLQQYTFIHLPYEENET